MDTKIMLLVEDNADDEALLRRALRQHSTMTSLDVARDGVEALDYLWQGNSTRPPPALVVMDLKLPRLDGLEVLRRLRADARTATLPVVVLTSSREEHDVRESYSLGANSYLRKPVDFHQFHDLVASIIHYWLTLNEPPPMYRRSQ